MENPRIMENGKKLIENGKIAEKIWQKKFFPRAIRRMMCLL